MAHARHGAICIAALTLPAAWGCSAKEHPPTVQGPASGGPIAGIQPGPGGGGSHGSGGSSGSGGGADASGDGGATQSCGLTTGIKVCDDCLNLHCCDQQLECIYDPTCLPALNCAVKCADAACQQACVAKIATAKAMYDCSSNRCLVQCTM